MGQLFSLNDVAVVLGFHVKTVELWCRKETIRAVKLGGRWRVPAEEVERIRQGGLPKDAR